MKKNIFLLFSIVLLLFGVRAMHAATLTLSGSDVVFGTITNASVVEATTWMTTAGPINGSRRGYVEFLLQKWYNLENTSGIFTNNITSVIFDGDRSSYASGSWATFHAMLSGEDGQITGSDYTESIGASLYTINYPLGSHYTIPINKSYLIDDILTEQASSGYNTRTTYTNMGTIVNPVLTISYNPTPPAEWTYINNSFTWAYAEATTLYKLWQAQDTQDSFQTQAGDTWLYTDSLGAGTPGDSGDTGTYKYIYLGSGGSGLITQIAVPEPATILLIILASIGMLFRKNSVL
ncbi:PEP-CTERM sorting domain-containing protein [bacterium]|nr:PEP-CTERM sorting domain-containing protein [bacterium]